MRLLRRPNEVDHRRCLLHSHARTRCWDLCSVLPRTVRAVQVKLITVTLFAAYCILMVGLHLHYFPLFERFVLWALNLKNSCKYLFTTITSDDILNQEVNTK